MTHNVEKLVCDHLGTWSNIWYGIYPKCQRIWCLFPSKITNGNYNLSQWSLTHEFGTILVPTCNTGYYMSKKVDKRVCEQPYKWSGNEPVCEIVKCKTPTVHNGNFISNMKPYSYSYNDEITIKCNEGFEIKDGSETRTCRADGTWSETPMQCLKIICNDTSNIRDQAIAQNAYPQLAFAEISRVTFNSTFYYLQQGSMEVQCSANKTLTWISKPMFGMTILINYCVFFSERFIVYKFKYDLLKANVFVCLYNIDLRPFNQRSSDQ